MVMRKSWIVLTAAVVLMLGLAACDDDDEKPEPTVPAPTATAEARGAVYEPVFEAADCPFEMPEAALIDCGFLIVPEDRSDPDSPDIRIFAAILRHPDGNPEPDPIVQLHGGPGGPALPFFPEAYPAFAALHATNRDVIVFDQRGTGLSEPTLDCPEYADAMIETFDFELDGQQLASRQVQEHLAGVLADCSDGLGEIADLSAYNSATSAADVNDLRIALGYEQVNLHGESYGTRLALSVMRDYPEGVRSVVLDAPSGTDETFEGWVGQVKRALNETFEGCAADEACDAAFPDLRDVWIDTVNTLDESPVSIEATNPATEEKLDVVLTGAALTTAVWRLHYSTDAIPVVPLFISMASEGEYGAVEEFYGEFLGLFSELYWGQFYSVECREKGPLSSLDELEAAIAASPEVASFLDEGPLLGRAQFAACENWDSGAAPASEAEPVISDIPTLVITGEYDPATEVSTAQRIADGLENGYGPFIFPAMGHVVSLGEGVECPFDVVTAFIVDPSMEPDTSCIAEMGGPEFVIEME